MSPDTRRELWQRCDAQPGSAERSRQPTERRRSPSDSLVRRQRAGLPENRLDRQQHRGANAFVSRPPDLAGGNRRRPPTHCGLRHGPRRRRRSRCGRRSGRCPPGPRRRGGRRRRGRRRKPHAGQQTLRPRDRPSESQLLDRTAGTSWAVPPAADSPGGGDSPPAWASAHDGGRAGRQHQPRSQSRGAASSTAAVIRGESYARKREERTRRIRPSSFRRFAAARAGSPEERVGTDKPTREDGVGVRGR